MKVTGTDDKEYTVEPDANSSGADLWRANLSKADLRDTNLSDANLNGANLSKSIGGRSDGTLVIQLVTLKYSYLLFVKRTIPFY